jgi:hypothetical protein
MLYVFLLLSLPALLVFSLYHLAVWLVPVRFGPMEFWRRVAFSACLAHLALLAGLAALALAPAVLPSVTAPLLGSGEVFAILWVWDTAGSLLLGAAFGLVGEEMSSAIFVLLALVAYLGLGSLQWYWLAGGLAAAFERLWESLRTPGDHLPDWF